MTSPNASVPATEAPTIMPVLLCGWAGILDDPTLFTPGDDCIELDDMLKDEAALGLERAFVCEAVVVESALLVTPVSNPLIINDYNLPDQLTL